MALYLSIQRHNFIEQSFKEALVDDALIGVIPSILTETVLASLRPHLHSMRNFAEAACY